MADKYFMFMGGRMCSGHDRCRCRRGSRFYIRLFICLFSSVQWITCILGNKNAKRSMASDISVSVDLVT